MEPRLLQARILIVDDEIANIALLRRVLQRAGFNHIDSTTQPLRATGLFDETRPDLVILDLRMPGLDGFGVIEQLLARTPMRDYVPILAITGDTSHETRERVIAAGARDYLEKPFRETEVLVRVENLLTTRFLHLSLQRHNDELESAVRARTAELELALSAAEAASRAKSRFLATMSHELRTPLNAVIGFAKHLRRNRNENLTPQELTYLDRIGENGVQLLRTISDVLDLSRIESGGMPLESVPVPVNQLLEEVVSDASMTAAADAGEIDIRLVARPDLSVLVTDGTKLRQVVQHLVSNAVKFTEAGSVVVGLHYSDEGRPVRIDVVDTGVGIAPSRLTAVFAAFEQEDNSMQRRFGGSGLGLAIARTLCDFLGLRLSVVSELNQGSAFSVLLERGAVTPSSYQEMARKYLEVSV